MNNFQFLKESLQECDNLCRLGGFRDGGYVLPFSAIINSTALISGGIGSTARFEVDMLDINPKLHIVPIDYSFSKPRMLVRTAYHFFKKKVDWRISLLENLTALILTSKFRVIKKWINSKYSILDIVNQLNTDNHRLVIKLDIEGSEFEILESILRLESKVSAMCIEFHNLDIQENRKKLQKFIDKTELSLIYISINEGSVKSLDPSIIELSFSNTEFLNNRDQYLQASFNPGKIELMTI